MRDSRSHRLGTDTRYLKLYLGIHCTPYLGRVLGMVILHALPEAQPNYCQVRQLGSLVSTSLLLSLNFLTFGQTATLSAW